MDRVRLKSYHKERRKRRVRKKIRGTSLLPRVSIYKSNIHLYAQAIDDDAGVTIASAGTYGVTLSAKHGASRTNSEVAKEIGETLSKRLLEKNIRTAVYDCNGNRYHGIVKRVAESMREAGIQI